VLSEREVTPQLGLLKSTLLQLDSTFSEREYGAGSFRDFMEKVAQTGAVTLKHAGRSMLVESREEGIAETEEASASASAERAPEPIRQPAPVQSIQDDEDEEAMPVSPMTMQDGIRAVQRAIHEAQAPPRWPMYVRQAKQFLRNAIENFDERKYGFASVVDLLRAAGKEGVLRIERDRQGAVRVFPGPNLTTRPAAPRFEEPVELDETVDVEVPQRAVLDPPAVEESGEVVEQVVDAAPIVDAESVQEVTEDEPADEAVVQEEKPRRARARKTTGGRAQKATRPRVRKTTRGGNR